MRAALVASCLRGALPEREKEREMIDEFGVSGIDQQPQRTSGGLAGGLLRATSDTNISNRGLLDSTGRMRTLVRAMVTYRGASDEERGRVAASRWVVRKKGAGNVQRPRPTLSATTLTPLSFSHAPLRQPPSLSPALPPSSPSCQCRLSASGLMVYNVTINDFDNDHLTSRAPTGYWTVPTAER